MKRALVWIVVAAQLGVLAFMAGEREWVARTGETVWLRTAPIDPNDPMRGDYVRLNYEISEVPVALCRDGVKAWFEEGTVYSRVKRDARVFATLRVDEFGLAELVSLSDQRPADGLYLRGRVDWLNDRAVQVRYGVEAFFMEQGAARAFENAARGDKLGVPVNAKIAVSPGGLAVLRDYQWERLGMTISLLWRDAPDNLSEQERQAFRRPLIGATVALKNHSDEPVAIIDLPRGGSFRLLKTDRWNRGTLNPVERGTAPAPRRDNVVLLAPAAVHEIRLDFTRPEWFVVREGDMSGEPFSLETLANDFSAWFRVEYAPPGKEACANLPHAELIQHRRLRSRAFNTAGAGFD